MVYKQKKAIGVKFNVKEEGATYTVFLKEKSNTPVLGNFSFENHNYNFTPIVPFSPGETYHIYQNNTLFSHFTIKENTLNTPELITIYPTKDTVPENLLKMYFIFSEPMQEVGNPLDFIVIKNITDLREESIFLELEAELWNKEHTQLTLWLDPGRIKTDLIPNKEKGLPLINGKEYQIQISSDWRAANGQSLKRGYEKTFHVSSRDSYSPKISEWKVIKPLIATKKALKIDFMESLDALLSKETIRFFTSEGTLINGTIELQLNEQGILFYPDEPWKKGDYSIHVAPKLEDLAGNNLNHVFDRDLSIETSTTNKMVKSTSIDFSIN